MKITDTHIYFWGDVYSNFHPCVFEINGIDYNSTEQYFMAMKAVEFGDNNALDIIMKTTIPSIQKAAGRNVRNFNQKRWDMIRYDIMYTGVLAKFTQNNYLRRQILVTRNLCFVEASPNDLIWGVGLRENDPLILDSNNWRGLNLLGKALNDVRNHLKGSRYDNRMEKP